MFTVMLSPTNGLSSDTMVIELAGVVGAVGNVAVELEVIVAARAELTCPQIAGGHEIIRCVGVHSFFERGRLPQIHDGERRQARQHETKHGAGRIELEQRCSSPAFAVRVRRHH